MQTWNRIPLIIIATIILTVAYQKHSSKTLFPGLLSSPQNSPTIDSSDSGLVEEQFEAISKVLNTIEKGRATLQLIEAYQINMRFEAGNGSRFIPPSNEIVIDSNIEPISAVLILVHEVTHARYYHEGLAANINLLNRPVYTQMKIDEEVMAVINSIEVTMELAESGVNVAELRHALYFPYRQAHGAAVRAAKSDYSGLDDGTLHQIGRTAGRTTVEQAFLTGEVVTSTTQQSYSEYWGSIWDQNVAG